MSLESAQQNGPEKKEMSQEAIDALRMKMSVAKGLGITQDDIDHAVSFLVQDAEKRGEPYTIEEIQSFNDKMQTDVLNALVKRVEARGTSSAQVFDSTGEHLGSAASRKEVQDKTTQAREIGR